MLVLSTREPVKELRPAPLLVISCHNAPSKSSRSALAPSEAPAPGLVHFDEHRVRTPGHGRARQKRSMNCGWPPDTVPAAPGSWTLCVASNTTGQPKPRMMARPRISTTRLL